MWEYPEEDQNRNTRKQLPLNVRWDWCCHMPTKSCCSRNSSISTCNSEWDDYAIPSLEISDFRDNLLDDPHKLVSKDVPLLHGGNEPIISKRP